jgi:hypothetical protein
MRTLHQTSGNQGGSGGPPKILICPASPSAPTGGRKLHSITNKPVAPVSARAAAAMASVVTSKATNVMSFRALSHPRDD